MKKESYEQGLIEGLKKIAGIGSAAKSVGKFIGGKPTATGAILGAAAGVLPLNTPLVVSPYTLSEGFHDTPERAKRRERPYLQKLPARILAGALTGAFLGKMTSNIHGEFKPKIVP